MENGAKIKYYTNKTKMTEEVKPEIIKGTQDALGKYIKKPILTEKLLKKPPFRFLYDICASVSYFTFL